MTAAALKGLVVLLCIVVVLPTLLFFGLRRLAHPLINARAKSPFNVEITAAGYLLYSCQVLFLLACALVYNIVPTGSVGLVLHRPIGIFWAIAITILGFGLIAYGLHWAGYPPTRRRQRGDV